MKANTRKIAGNKLPAEFYKDGFVDLETLQETKPTLLGNLEVY